MKIYIDGSFYKASGIGRYYESMLKELLNNGIEIITAVPKRLKETFESEFKNNRNLKPFYVNYEKFSIKNFLLHGSFLRRIEKEVDLFIYPHINLPKYVPSKNIIVIHDLRPLTNYWDRNEIKKLIFKFFLDRAILKSAKIICISNTVREELVKYREEVASKTLVIYEFPDEKFVNLSANKYDISPIIDSPYILYVGNRKLHKNLQGLLRAFNLIKNKIPNYKLVIVGGKEKEIDHVDKLIKELNLYERVIEFISSDDKTLIALYKYAKLFVLPSFIEGFGLPPLEAVSLGCPVVLSDINIFREIFGDAGIYFNPNNPEEMGEKILSLINNENLRMSTLNKQKDKISIFNKEKIIDKYLNLLKEVKEQQV